MNFQDEINYKTVLKIIQSGVTNKLEISEMANMSQAELIRIFSLRPKLKWQLKSEITRKDFRELNFKILREMRKQHKEGRLNLIELCDKLGIKYKKLVQAFDCSPDIRETYARFSK